MPDDDKNEIDHEAEDGPEAQPLSDDEMLATDSPDPEDEG